MAPITYEHTGTAANNAHHTRGRRCFLQRAARQGNAEAMFLLGHMYMGEGGAGDHPLTGMPLDSSRIPREANVAVGPAERAGIIGQRGYVLRSMHITN